VQLSAFSIVDGPGSADPARDRYGEVLGLARESEAAGLRGVWIAEHHFHTGGLCPAPSVLLATIGAQTARLRLGSLVTVLPFHSPVELAEQFALLDRLTAGRVELGVGSGFLAQEFEGFGIRPEEKRELFDRNFEVLLAALRGEPVRVPGRSGVPVELNVRPVQQPHPPVRVAVQRREAVAHMARRGLSIALIPYATLDRFEDIGAIVKEYRANLPSDVPGSVAVALHVYTGARPDLARAALQRYLDGRLQIHSTHYVARVEHDPRAATASGIEASGLAWIGSGASNAERARALAAMGVDELLGIFDFGALDPEEVARSVARTAEALGVARGDPAR
jgi:alkanesulfonate monooxygenase SsuD/methylene tetrahydromethanopterin reductase-like flavin-dependent oxidoreductase (luciferase family)